MRTEHAVVQTVFAATPQRSVVQDVRRIATPKLSVDNMALWASKIVLWTCVAQSLGQSLFRCPNVPGLTTSPADSAEVLQTFVTTVVRPVLADAVLPLDRFAETSDSLSALLGQS